MKPLVTIIMPSFNKPTIVGDAIASVLGQTYQAIEYIILENSTDLRTKQIIKKFTDKRIRYIDVHFTQKERRDFYPPAYLCNRYYPKAKGEFILFLADDDVLMPQALATMVSFLQKNPRADVCYHDQFIVYMQSGKALYEPLARGADMLLTYPNHNPKDMLDGGQIMLRKSILRSLKQPFFPQGWQEANICDKLFMEKIWKTHAFYPVKKILTIKRVFTDSTFRSRNPLEFYLYCLCVQFLPVWMQRLLGEIRHKRRLITKYERRSVLRVLSQYEGYHGTGQKK